MKGGMNRMKIGVIAGSGVDLPGFEFIEERAVDSEYGTPSESYKHFRYNSTDVYFLRRHGARHKIPPHRVNYRANIYGFKRIGADAVVAVSAVGGINSALKPGDIAVTANAIDFTNGRNATYFHDDEVFHIDMTNPFCPALRKQILSAAKRAKVKVYDGGVYLCTNGPRYETAAEIAAYSRLGADFVGMTLFPECVLAREIGVCYANISVITNYAAGITGNKLTSDEVIGTMGISSGYVQSILHSFIDNLSAWECGCKNTLNGAKISDE